MSVLQMIKDSIEDEMIKYNTPPTRIIMPKDLFITMLIEEGVEDPFDIESMDFMGIEITYRPEPDNCQCEFCKGEVKDDN